MTNQENELLSVDGTVLNREIFDKLFNDINTYVELPLMLELAAYEVARSEYDSLKEHAVAYHIAGLVSVVSGVKKALKQLEDEVKILGINLEDEMDSMDIRKYRQLIKNLETFI